MFNLIAVFMFSALTELKVKLDSHLQKDIFYLLKWKPFKNDENADSEYPNSLPYNMISWVASNPPVVTGIYDPNKSRARTIAIWNLARKLNYTNKINIFFFENHVENKAERLFPDLFNCFLKMLYMR